METNTRKKTLTFKEVNEFSTSEEQAVYLDAGARYTTVDIDRNNKKHRKVFDVYKTLTPFTIQNKIHFYYPNVETRAQFYLNELHVRVK